MSATTENQVPTAPLREKVTRRLRRRTDRGRAVSGLRSQWSAYPKNWKRHRHLNLDFETLGEEWGGPEFADAVVDDLVGSRLGPDMDVLEIGCGGGKFSQRIAPKVRSLIAADISPAMIEQTRGELARRGIEANVTFKQLNGISFEGVESKSLDFVFSYDVQLHMQPQNVYSYMLDARRVLRPGGVFMLHQINLASKGGMGHFLSQFHEDTWDYAFDSPARLGHIYFMSRDQMSALADAAGLELEIVDDFPGENSPLYDITSGRDLFGFMKAKPSRLDEAGASARVVQVEADPTVWVVLADGTRAAVRSAVQFDRAGLSWDAIELVSSDSLAAIPETDTPLKTWE